MKTNRKMMKKRIFALVTVLFMAVMPAMSQVFLTEEEMWESSRAEVEADYIGNMVPMENVTLDQWKHVPLGNGLLLLAGMGAAYQLGKRKKND